jgi:hypothetical protein
MLWEKILCEQWHSARIFQHDTQLFGDLSPGTVQHSLRKLEMPSGKTPLTLAVTTLPAHEHITIWRKEHYSNTHSHLGLSRILRINHN